MTRPYSEDMRERAVARFESGETIRSIGEALGIDPSWVPKWVKRKRETGSVAPDQIGGRKPRTLSGDIALWRRERLRSGPFTTRGLTDELAGRGVKTDRRAVWTFVREEGLSFKKSLFASEQDRPDVARKRERWKARQASIDPARLVLIDETWVKTNMTPLRGWGRKGQRLLAKAPHGHWKTMTFIAALRCDRIDAPLVIDRPINGESFAAYVEQVLVPTLKKDDIVVLDNLGSHKGAGVRPMVRAAGARMIFLPPYSPDLNPIEQVFAKLKQPSSNTKCARRHNARSKTHGDASAPSCQLSRQPSAPNISKTQDMLPYEYSTV
jgi:transposase